jgi:hypothetical protein
MRSLSILASLFWVFSTSVYSATPWPCVEEKGAIVKATAATNFYLKPGQCLVSPQRKWMVTMQATDGNFVQSRLVNDIAKEAVWHTKTGGNRGAGLLVQQDGHFVVYKPGGITFPNGGPAGTPNMKLYESNKPEKTYADYSLYMQDDGNLVLYKETGRNPGKKFASWDHYKKPLPPPAPKPGRENDGWMEISWKECISTVFQPPDKIKIVNKCGYQIKLAFSDRCNGHELLTTIWAVVDGNGTLLINASTDSCQVLGGNTHERYIVKAWRKK